jgi:hypothetical protein
MNGKGKKTGGLTFKEYINNATVQVVKCENWNSHVTLTESNRFTGILWDGHKNGTKPKYPQI